MKTILIPTDFSDNTAHALKYGYLIARQIKANILLCNAVIIPAEMPQAGFVVWPMEESDTLLKDSDDELLKLKASLERTENHSGFKPAVSCVNETGLVTDVVNQITQKEQIDLVVIGTHRSDGLSTFLLGDHSRSLIDGINKPLLLVPPGAHIGAVKKIAFATDFKTPDDDLTCIYALIALVRPLNADILLTHIYTDEHQSTEFTHRVKQFMRDLSDKADYPHIYYHVIKDQSIQIGLNWLCENEQIDIMAMVHRSHTFIDSLFRESQTQKTARQLPIPLLVFPGNS